MEDERELPEILKSIESDVSGVYSNTSNVDAELSALNSKMEKVIELLGRIAKATEGMWNDIDRLAP